MIDLTDLRMETVDGQLVDYGARLAPFLGGVEQRINRIGTRHAITLKIPPMRIEAEGRRWIARLIRAKQEGGYARYPQVNFRLGVPGNPTVETETVGGRFLPITGATANYAIREGQALTVTSDGRRYFYFAAAQTILDADGAGTIELDVPLRKVALVGDTVNLSKPVIEGWIDGDGWGWTLESSQTTGLGFTIIERA